MGKYEISFTDRFWPSVYDLGASEVKQVVKAVNLLARDPFNDSLRLKQVEGDPKGRRYTCRASRDVRIFCFKLGNVLLLERAGHHDDIYNLARRVDLVYNAGAGQITLVDFVDNRTLKSPSLVGGPPLDDLNDARAFDHWSDADLRGAGFDAGEVAAIRACRNEDDVLDLPFGEPRIYQLIDMLGQTPEQWRTPSIDATAEAAEDMRRAIVGNGAVVGISQLFTEEEIAKLTAAPIEDWMVFLHPAQRAVVERHFEGPARVRGSAGTGKTVVALHRAAALVRRFREEDPAGQVGTVLFTTYIRSLPPILASLYRRLPTSRPNDRIEFTNVDRLAYRICRHAGQPAVIDEQKVENAFTAAYRGVVRPGSPLHGAGLSRAYLRDEIVHVIKGRALERLEDYLEVERIGRRIPFTEPMRRQIWELREAWDGQMADAGVVDYSDVIVRALDLVLGGRGPKYRAVIVDEAQDLTLAALRLLRALVNGAGPDRPNGLFIVGDGAQKIYPGGFTLRQAGVEVRGRTSVLRVNYRNTREIIDAAMAVAGRESVDDLGDRYERAEEAADAHRSGLKPVLVLCHNFDEQVEFIADRIRDVVDARAVGYGDIVVAVPTNRQAGDIRKQLEKAGVPTVALEDYDGRPVERVKVGTHFRVKGLEFKIVFLPCLGAEEFPRPRAHSRSAEEYDEQRALAMSQLFVAMTRARDALFLLASMNPSSVLRGAMDRFEVLSL